MTRAAEAALEPVLGARRWWRRREPFSHVWAQGVFRPQVYSALEAEIRRLLARGVSDRPSATRLARTMPLSDAASWTLPPDVRGPLALFYSRAWHELLRELTGATAGNDVNAAVHHHQRDSDDGFVHRDLHVGRFTDQPRADGINPIDLARCSYFARSEPPPGRAREVVRAVTMIFFLANPPWRPGDGGETALYRQADDRIDRPAVAVPPRNNSLLVFENTPRAYHAFLSNRRSPRTSVIVWLHRSRRAAEERFGAQALEWPDFGARASRSRVRDAAA